MKSLRPTAWPALVTVAAFPLLCYLLTAGNYGIFRDEYYYLACARHLAWGYVDHPPLSIAVLALVRALFGEGVMALRLVPALCGSSLVVLVGLIARKMGGGTFAQALAAVSMAIVGVAQVITGFYSMNAIDLVVWAAAWLLLAGWAMDVAPRQMLLLGLILGLGLLNKVGVLIFGAALGLAIVCTPLRRALLTRWPYVGAAIALGLFAPHVVWQLLRGWPTLEFISNAQQYKIRAMEPGEFFGELVLQQQPANLLVWVVGLGWLLFAPQARRFRLLGLTFAFGLVLLFAQKAKPYYAAGLFPVLFAAGACAWERFTVRGRRFWLRPALLVLLIASGLFFLPLGVPLLPVETYARWQAWTGIAPASAEVGHTSELPQHYSDRFGWEELAQLVGRVVASLPEDERDGVFVIARNYGEAASLEYWAERYGVPAVYSGHNNYSFWSPESVSVGTVVVVGWDEEDVRESFSEVELVGRLEADWALEDRVSVWVARGAVLSWSEIRDGIRVYI